jgi:hypothetical protein
MHSATINLLSNADATGAQVILGIGGVYQFTAAGTFGGATVSLQILGPDAVTWFNAGTDAVLTAAGGCIVELGNDSVVRAAVTGGSPSGLFSRLRAVSN